MPTVQHLAALEAADLVRLAALEPELEYLFRHKLVQDVAYDSLVRADRRRLHRRVGEVLERLRPPAAGSGALAPTLAWHFLEAGEERRALAYFWAAAQAAEAVYAIVEAAAHYRSALDIARRLPPGALAELAAPPHEITLQSVFLRSGEALQHVGNYDEAIGLYLELERLAKDRGDAPLELAAVLAHSTVRSTPSLAFDPAHGETLSHQALALATSLGDRVGEARALWHLMLVGFFGGRQTDMRYYGERALALARELGEKELLAYILNDLAGYVYSLGVEQERGRAALVEARGIWRELGNLRMLTDNLSTAAIVDFTRGRFQRALDQVAEAEPIVLQTANTWGQAYCQGVRGTVLVELGRLDEAVTALRLAIEIGENSFVAAPVIARSNLAGMYYWLGDYRRGQETVEPIVKVVESQVAFWLPQVMGILALNRLALGDVEAAAEAVARGRAAPAAEWQYSYFYFLLLAECELALAHGQPERAATRAAELVGILRGRAVLAFVPQLLWVQGRALMALGNQAEARSAFQASADLAREQGSVHAHWRALAALAELSGPGQAEGLRREARQILDEIASHVASAELQATFLNRPDVRELMQA